MNEDEKAILDFFKYVFAQALLQRDRCIFQCDQKTPTVSTFWVRYLPDLCVSITSDVNRTYFRCRVWNVKRGYDEAVVIGHGLIRQTPSLSWLSELYVSVWNAYHSASNQKRLRELRTKLWN